MCYTNLDVLVPGEVGLSLEHHLPCFMLPHHLSKHISVVGDDALDTCLMVQVLESLSADPVLHSSGQLLLPRLTREVTLHTDIMYHSII